MCDSKTTYLNAFGANNTVSVVNDAELGNPAFVRAVRNFSSSLPIKPSDCLDYAHALNRDLEVRFIQDGVRRIHLDMSPLEIDIEDADLLEACKAEERIRDWFRAIMTPVPSLVTPYVRLEAKERFRLWSTLLIASFPDIEWPRTIVSNDNHFAANDTCGFDKDKNRFPQTPSP
jgi:hypothetical protein